MENYRLTVAYLRLSQEDINRNNEFSSSIYNQLECIKSYARSIGLLVSKEYIDDGYSGINFERPGFEQLKDDIKKGFIGVVITKDMSRLGRNFLETLYYINDYFFKYKVRYIAVNDQFDSYNFESYEQQMMLMFSSLINERYVKECSIKRKQVALSKTKEGQFIGCMAPYGYKVKKLDDKRTLEIDNYAASIVKRIFTEIVNGKSRAEVAEELNKDKVLSPAVYMGMKLNKNRKYYYDWSDKIIYRILKNKIYTGRIVVRKSEKKDYHQKRRNVIPIDKRETIDNCHPVIITAELFELANGRLRQLKRKKNNYCGLLNQLVVCGECEKNMTIWRVNKYNKKIKYYLVCKKIVDRKKCLNRSISEDKLKMIVDFTLKDIICNYVDEDDILIKTLKKLVKVERYNLKISNLKDNIEFHNINIRNLYLQKIMGKINVEEFIEEKNKEVLLKEESVKKIREIINLKNKKNDKERLAKKYYTFINSNDFLNNIIRDLIDKIVVYKDNTIKIFFKFKLGEHKK